MEQKELLAVEVQAYVGIDPGEDGAIVMIQGDEVSASRVKIQTDKELWEGVSLLADFGVFACIEQQTPRPTKFYQNGGWQSTILASTCILYGRYHQARSFLIAAGIPFEDVPPKRWQKGLHIPDRPKGMKQTDWKNVLKAKAQELFPDEKVTLATADALLLAEYCRRSREGKL